MNPPYEINASILKSVASISQKIGIVNAKYLTKQTPHLRKENKIKTIHSSLQIEGNTLSEQQITAIIDNKNVVGPRKDILEVTNAISVYGNLSVFNSFSENSFLSAHKSLMKNLITDAGKYRRKGVGIVKGSKLKHLAPSFEKVPYLTKELFNYLKKGKELSLIKSCVFRYEMEFIHPFMDGNGRMGRLWQTVILMNDHPFFEFLPFETLISKNQNNYYKALAISDSEGKSTVFIEYMLGIIDESLYILLNYNNRTLKNSERLEYFISLGKTTFSRKDYMDLFKEISAPTASRDLKMGVINGLLEKAGDKKTTLYKVRK